MYLPCAAQEFGFALLERDRIDHGLALRDFQTRREHLPLRGVDHRRHAGDFRLRGHQVEERAHGFDAVDHAVVHADVDDLRPRIDLRTGYRQSLFVIALADQAGEFGRACDVGALADVDEIGFGCDAQRLQSAQRRDAARRRNGARGIVAGDFRKFEDMRGRRAAASADDIDQSAAHVFAHVLGEHLRGLVVAAHDVGKPGVGVCRDAERGRFGQPFEVGQQLFGSVGAVQAEGEQLCVRQRGAEGLDGLSRQGAAAGVGQRARRHDADRAAEFFGQRVDRVEGRLGVERVEDGLDQQDVGSAVQQSPRLIGVGFDELCESHFAGRGVRHVGRHRGRAVGGSHRTRHEAGFLRVAGREFVGRAAGRGRRRSRHFVGVRLQSVIGQRYGVGVERVGFDDVGPRLQVFDVDFAHRFGLRQGQQVVAPLEQRGPLAEPFAPVVLFCQSVLLDHGAEAAVEQQDAGFELFVYVGHLFLSDFDFKQFVPVFARDEDAPSGRVVCDAVQHVGRRSHILFG